MARVLAARVPPYWGDERFVFPNFMDLASLLLGVRVTTAGLLLVGCIHTFWIYDKVNELPAQGDI